MADLAQLKQKPDESAKQFIMRFKRVRTRCHTHKTTYHLLQGDA